MSFLQPALLLGLAFALLPVLIHLLNKRRHRTLAWAAMMFLVRATQQARGRRKLKHFLILACRVLGTAALAFALSRPLAGGWVSWFGGNRPEAIVVLFDRSASMETAPDEHSPTKREAALEKIRSAVGEYASGSRVVLVDSAGGDALELNSVGALAELPQTGRSEAAADIPGMFERAIDYLSGTKPGKAEIWVVSDLQESNWQPGDGRWQTIRAGLLALGQDVPVRVLGLTAAPTGGHSVQIVNVVRDGAGLALDLELRGTAGAIVPLSLSLNGAAETQESVTLTQPVLQWRKRIALGDTREGGWGRLTLGPDTSPADNHAWFAYGADQPLQTAVVSADRAGRVLALAAAPSAADGRLATVLAPTDAHRIDWDKTRLVIWQAPLPDGAVATQLREFLESGGSVAFFPPASVGAPGGGFAGIGWSTAEDAPDDGKFQILSWENTSGPLANFVDGRAMAVERLFIIKRRSPVGDASVLATFTDGTPAVLRQFFGRGQAVYLATLPDPHWSDLGSYNVLLPMLERLLAASARYANEAPTLALGDRLPDDSSFTGAWENIDAAETGASSSSSPGVRAGIYRRGPVLAALNVPPAEVLPGTIDRDVLTKILDGVKVRLLEESVAREQGLATEIWRAFAIALLCFLLAEALLSLPAPRKPDTEVGTAAATP